MDSPSETPTKIMPLDASSLPDLGKVDTGKQNLE